MKIVAVVLTVEGWYQNTSVGFLYCIYNTQTIPD